MFRIGNGSDSVRRLNNKSGFVLAEAIIVGVFVLGLFTFLFMNVIPLIGRYEAAEGYDTVDGVYNANLIRAMLMKDQYVDNVLKIDDTFKKYNVSEFCQLLSDENYCVSLIGGRFIDVDAIYVTWYRLRDFKAYVKNHKGEFNRATRDYVKTLDDYNQPSGEIYSKYKRLIIAYKNGEFANIEVKIKDVPSYTIQLVAEGADVPGTGIIYEMKGVKFSLDAAGKKIMTPPVSGTGSCSNPVEIPKRAHYDFDGYYTEKNGSGKIYISATGCLVSEGKDLATFDSNATLYAKWVAEEGNLPVDSSLKNAHIVATNSVTNNAVASKAWTNNGLNFKLTLDESSDVNSVIKYCSDKTNTCDPNTVVANNSTITALNTINGEYYFRYKVVSPLGLETTVAAYEAKIDKIKPTCNFTAGSTAVLISYSDQGGSTVKNAKVKTPSTTVDNVENNKTFSYSRGIYEAWVEDRAGNVGVCKLELKDATCTNVQVSTGSTVTRYDKEGNKIDEIHVSDPCSALADYSNTNPDVTDVYCTPGFTTVPSCTCDSTSGYSKVPSSSVNLCQKVG